MPPDRLPTDDASGLWVAALQARLLAEERRLFALIATLPGANRVRLAEEVELPEYLDPDLLKTVTELARAG